MITKKLLDNLKDAFDKIRDSSKYRYLTDLLAVKNDLRDTLLKKIFK